jgi:hypothetical protein
MSRYRTYRSYGHGLVTAFILAVPIGWFYVLVTLIGLSLSAVIL